MKAQNTTYAYDIYPGSGHAYMRPGDNPNGSEENKHAKIKSLERIRGLILGN